MSMHQKKLTADRKLKLGVCPERRTLAGGNATSCIRDASRAVSNAACSFQCRRKPFGLLPQGMRLRHPCRRLDRLDAALELRHGKETAASCIMMQSMTVPLAVCLVNLTFPSRLLDLRCELEDELIRLWEKTKTPVIFNHA